MTAEPAVEGLFASLLGEQEPRGSEFGSQRARLNQKVTKFSALATTVPD
jgi:hypothetical protein